MKNKFAYAIYLLLLCIVGTMTMAAQTFHISPVVTPETVIDGQTIAHCHHPTSVAIGPTAEVAFTTYCSSGDYHLQPSFVMTSHHIVAKDDDVIDGKRIKLFSDHLAINARGQVAYSILFLDDGKDPNDSDSWHEGICVDRHFLEVVPQNTVLRSLTLTDDGKVLLNQTASASNPIPTPQPSKQSSILNKIPFKMPPLKLPKNIPIGIPSIPQIPQTATPTTTPATTAAPSPFFTTNTKGQAVIVSGLDSFGFVIFVATPTN